MSNTISKKLKSYLPILEWLPKYKKTDLQGDLSAGLTVGIMLIPQGMAYAMLAGLEPIHGLYAVTVPLLLYAIFGTSRQLAVGPVAMVSLLTASGIASLNAGSPEQYLIYALTLAFLVGLIQFGMGALKLGFVVNFLSHPVISGFTSAAAIIIGLSQIKHLFRINLPNSEHIQEMAVAIFQNIGDIHWITFAIGLIGIIIIKYGKKIHKSFPAPLVAVVVGIGLVASFDLTQYGVKIVGDVPSGLPTLSSPSFDMQSWKTLLPIAFTISLVGFAESFAVAKTIQAKHKNYRLNANQELIALGIANFGSAFFKGYPVTGGFSRTAVNNDAGAKTTMASIISAVLIVLTLLFFTGLFYNLPSAILAAVVLVAVSGLIDFKEPVHLWHKDKFDFTMLVATFIITLTLGIETGIISGMVLSLLVVIYKASRPHMAQLGRVPGSNIYRNIDRFSDLDVKENLLMIRIDGPIYFANVEYIKDKLDKWIHERNDQVKMIVFNMESVTNIDSTGAHELNEWINTWRNSGTDICMTSIKGPVRDVLNRWAILESVGADHVFVDDNSAVSSFDHKMDSETLEKYTPYAIQSNLKK
ncbi:high affinity sulfate transporter 1 [Belliella baltica DSM 15883]|uniref:High affinity sulfate transporter 1 n=1 Tax=Belliella baltica (strain DSM 15883 / CIP 108006 / LMG 21964 / BA134) TaxID=866536 RepID=I3Z9W0_BELBD|nr:solute carrier family 26 protein [Belliella baltica]AFL86028.1 high affinity sulfate transporter 1 [Belliella baltica DSM 15883]